jgi:uncharacterized protein YukE
MTSNNDPQPLDLDRLVGAFSEDLGRLVPETESGPGDPEEQGAFAGPVDLASLQTPTLAQDLRARFQQVQDEVRRQHAVVFDRQMNTFLRSIREATERLEQSAEARREQLTAPADGMFVVAGRVLDVDTGEALPGVRVQAVERDPKHDDVLGEVRTDREGFYRLEYTEESFHAPQDEEPETHIRVLDEEGNALFTSDQSYRHEAETVEVIDAAVEGSKVSDHRELGKQIRENAQAELKKLRRRAETLENRHKLQVDPLSILPSEGQGDGDTTEGN